MATCLVIAEDPGTVAAAQRALAGAGHVVTSAPGAEEGMRLLAASPVDVVIIDRDVRGAGGAPLAEELQRNEFDLGVVLTQRAAGPEEPSTLRRGMKDPWDAVASGGELRASVERCLDRLHLKRQRDALARRERTWVEAALSLVDLAARIGTARPLDVGLQAFLEEVVRAQRSEAGAFWLLEAASDSLVCRATCRLPVTVLGMRLGRERGFLWESLLRTPESDRPFEGRASEACDAEWAGEGRIVLAAPARCRGHALGVLALVVSERDPTGAGSELLPAAAGILGLALHFARAEQDLSHARLELARVVQDFEASVVDRTRACRELEEGRRVALLELERTHRLLRRARAVEAGRERMAMLGQVAAGLAHEINNPLAFVASNLETLERHVRTLRGVATSALRPRDPEARADRAPSPDIGRIREALDEAAPLFEEMRTGLARITEVIATLSYFADDIGQGATTAEVDLNLEIRRVLLLLQGSGLRFLPIETQLDPLPSLSLPALGLRQLLLDLVGRLLRSARGSGGLRITTFQRDPGVWLEVVERGGDPDGHDLQVQAAAGSAQPACSAAHLRLQDCCEAAGRLGGVMSLEPSPPRGLCVRLRFPVHGGPVPRGAEDERV